jgi:hypothetical protein
MPDLERRLKPAKNVKDHLRASLKYLASKKDRDEILEVIARMEEEEREVPAPAAPPMAPSTAVVPSPVLSTVVPSPVLSTKTCAFEGCEKPIPEERAKKNGKYCSNKCQYAGVKLRNSAAYARRLIAASAGRTESARRNPSVNGRAPKDIGPSNATIIPSIYEREMAADISLKREVPGWERMTLEMLFGSAGEARGARPA